MPPGVPQRPELRLLCLAPEVGAVAAAGSCSGSVPGSVSSSRPGSAPGSMPGSPERLVAQQQQRRSQHQQQQHQQQHNHYAMGRVVEKASDALGVRGYAACLPYDYHLVPSYGNEHALLSSVGGGDGGRTRTRTAQRHGSSVGGVGADSAAGAVDQGDGGTRAAAGTAAGAANDSGSEDAVVEDYGEFMYFIVSPKVIMHEWVTLDASQIDVGPAGFCCYAAHACLCVCVCV